MGIVSFSPSPVLSLLLAPVHALAAWFVPAEAHRSPFTVPDAARRVPRQPTFPLVSARAVTRQVPPAPSPASPQAGSACLKKSRPSRLKVVREFEPGVSPACAGRMVISGRIADVCAELERMSQRESPPQ